MVYHQKEHKNNNGKNRAMLLTTLYVAQEQYGWLSPDAIKRVAKRLGLSPGQVYSTASFYSMFKLHPYGQHHIQVCEGLSCYLVGGAEPIIDFIRQFLHIEPGETTPDGLFSLDIVQCLAACDVAPAIKVNDELWGNLTFGKIEDQLSALKMKGVL